ncbi:MAG: prepilin-type N-terminal cleavage/methylation domain-containing protein [Lentisphaerae bacterium]|nr:prepilin-type N-terminal cleavage/methylation domain-containing protein [Lentisphaerota bacterium]
MNSQRRTTIARGQRSEVRGQRSDQSLASGVCYPASGFTLIELLVAIALLAMAMAMTFTTFYSVIKAWQRGTAMAADLDHGEFVMQQITYGLRSAFFPPAVAAATATNAAATNAAATNAVATAAPAMGGRYGFVLEDHGAGAGAQDIISWVKTGTALLGLNDPLYKGLHRVQLSIEDDGDSGPAVAVRAWRPYANPIDFDPAEIPPRFISSKVVGMDCRVAREMKDGQWDWLEVWEDEATNCLPLVAEITLYLEPLDPGELPVEVRRTTEIPIAPLSWSSVQKKP